MRVTLFFVLYWTIEREDAHRDIEPQLKVEIADGCQAP